MKNILLAASVALMVSILFTPYMLLVLARQGFGQEIREKVGNPQVHRRGTPTMGGLAILAAIWAGYLLTNLLAGQGPSASGLLVLGLASALGVIGFLDDAKRIRHRRNVGMSRMAELVGPLVAAMAFAVLALRFPDRNRLTPASMHLSFVRDIPAISFGSVGFVVFTYLAVSGWSTAVRVTDGMDGLASGTAAMVLATYVLISFWHFRAACSPRTGLMSSCYQLRDALDVAVLAAAAMAACVGFLWWNAAPARILMGRTGSLALGGLLAGLSMVTRTELLMVIIGAVFVVEALSVALQVVVFRGTGRRLFRMAPFHNHFELAGWAGTTVIIRFWMFAAIGCLVGLGVFYGDWQQLLGGS